MLYLCVLEVCIFLVRCAVRCRLFALSYLNAPVTWMPWHLCWHADPTRANRNTGICVCIWVYFTVGFRRTVCLRTARLEFCQKNKTVPGWTKSYMYQTTCYHNMHARVCLYACASVRRKIRTKTAWSPDNKNAPGWCHEPPPHTHTPFFETWQYCTVSEQIFAGEKLWPVQGKHSLQSSTLAQWLVFQILALALSW